MLIFGELHLQLVLAEYQTYYKGRRPIAAASAGCLGPAAAHLSQHWIKRRAILASLIHEYERAA